MYSSIVEPSCHSRGHLWYNVGDMALWILLKLMEILFFTYIALKICPQMFLVFFPLGLPRIAWYVSIQIAITLNTAALSCCGTGYFFCNPEPVLLLLLIVSPPVPANRVHIQMHWHSHWRSTRQSVLLWYKSGGSWKTFKFKISTLYTPAPRRGRLGSIFHPNKCVKIKNKQTKNPTNKTKQKNTKP